MFPQTPLMLGSGLFWSMFPLTAVSANPANPGSSELGKASVSAAAEVKTLASLIDRQRVAVREAEIDVACRVCGGLKAMFEVGDRRVMPLKDFLPDPECSSTGPPVYHPRRVLEIWHEHAELEDEALAACREPFTVS